ncbi:hypothetical protein HYDPIDRAFT_115051 [Hydnomerulius pinastri MD-312]|uniref:Uncharacterized protein n=1 Tax=Hydnomerulius pinastri MD-312 TaxID=994086 RepID=A0A0C9VVQ4_9AGAM|nr:hypothetical protein HYDPIDRAFT_115051 [Hydnomerulius pinastri MD-312]
MIENIEDILSDSLEILGGERVEDPGYVQYGVLKLTVAPKEGKANTLLADHLFSPALLLAELIETRVIQVAGRTMIELGAGCALPSLLAATLPEPPSLVVVTDYPDNIILGNLKDNVERNREHYRSPCVVQCAGYEWGTDTTPLIHYPQSSDSTPGYDMVIMSDLLHFRTSHDVLVLALKTLLAKSPKARVYVAAGKYTAPHVCDNFLILGSSAGLIWEEDMSCTGGDSQNNAWMGTMNVSGLDMAQLSARKSMCRLWVGRWSSAANLPSDVL